MFNAQGYWRTVGIKDKWSWTPAKAVKTYINQYYTNAIEKGGQCELNSTLICKRWLILKGREGGVSGNWVESRMWKIAKSEKGLANTKPIWVCQLMLMEVRLLASQWGGETGPLPSGAGWNRQSILLEALSFLRRHLSGLESFQGGALELLEVVLVLVLVLIGQGWGIVVTGLRGAWLEFCQGETLLGVRVGSCRSWSQEGRGDDRWGSLKSL